MYFLNSPMRESACMRMSEATISWQDYWSLPFKLVGTQNLVSAIAKGSYAQAEVAVGSGIYNYRGNFCKAFPGAAAFSIHQSGCPTIYFSKSGIIVDDESRVNGNDIIVDVADFYSCADYQNKKGGIKKQAVEVHFRLLFRQPPVTQEGVPIHSINFTSYA